MGAVLYGRGVFTTLAVSSGAPMFWEKHWRRLTKNAASLGIDVAESHEQETLRALKDQIEKSGISDGRARITFCDEAPSRIWSSENGGKKIGLSIIVAARRPIPREFKLTISPYRVNTASPLVGIKTCNYLENILAHEEATERGFHEAVRLNERGEISSACMANLFWETDGRFYTPSLNTGCLPGTTREYILENIDCEEVEKGIDEMENAERIFLTSAGLGVVSVAEFDGRKLDTSQHPLMKLLPF